MLFKDGKIKYLEFAIFLFLTMVAFTYIKKISANVYSYYSLMIKVVPIICFYLLISKNLYKNKNVRDVILLLSIYLIWGGVISLLNGKGLFLIAYQTYHEIKYPLVFIILSGVFSSSTLLKNSNFKVFMVCLFILCIFDIIFREINPVFYDLLYKDGGHLGRGDFGEVGVLRHAGIFWHSSQLAIFSCLALLYFFNQCFSINRIKLSTVILIFFAVACLLASKQRFELLAIIMVFVLGCSIKFRLIKQSQIPLILGGVIAFSILVVPAYIYLTGTSLGELAEVPRFVFYTKAYIEMINTNFMGSGWGSLGSHSAADVANAYSTLDWQQYWWIKEGLYSYDTFWPHIIAEVGIIGIVLTILLMCSIVNLFSSVEAKLMFVFLVLTSLSTSNVQSFFYLLVTFAFILAAEIKEYGYSNR